MKMLRIAYRVLAGLGIATALMQGPALAWPDRPVQLIVGFPPGGAADVIARALATDLSRTLKQQVVVVNKEGAAGIIAMSAAANAAADGHTLVFGPVGPLTLQPHLKASLPYQPDDFAGICQTFTADIALYTGANGTFRTMKDVIAAAKDAPGKIVFGFGGLGTMPHLAPLQLTMKAGVELQGVPYRGDPAVILAIRSGELQLGSGVLGLALNQGFRPLVVFSPARLPQAPDVPTATELGYPVVGQVFGGLLGLKAIPAPVRKAVEAACARAVETADYQAAARSTQQDVSFLDGEAFTQRIAEESRIQRDVIRAAGIRLE